MRRLIYITGFALFVLSCGTKRNKIFNLSKDELVKEIAKENLVAGGAVGIAGIEPDQWVRYVALKAKTNEQDLIELTNHPNKAVKCYAFTALSEQKSDALFSVLLKNISDTGKIESYYGCLHGSLTVAEFYIQKAVSGDHINLIEKRILDSVILFRGDPNLISQFDIFENFTANPNRYSLIKERVNQDPKYIIALSKYRNPNDRETIFNLLESTDRSTQYLGILAVINYPDSLFFPQLRELAKTNYGTLVEDQEEYLSALYKALVQYKDKTSKDILKQSIQKSTGIDSIKKIDLVYGALKKYPDSVYKNLIQYF